MKCLRALAAAALLAGCAADTMRSYVGRDIREVELQYGPATNQIDLAPGSRAFQWTKVSVDTTPVTATSVTEKKKGRKYTTTQFSGGDQEATSCVYTFITAWNEPRGSWIVTGIREPSLACALGGLN